jgi:hypothetical protein
LLGQVGQQERQAGDVVAGIEDDPESRTIQMSGSPGRQCPASRSRSVTSRSWPAVTAVASSVGPSRTASSTAVQLLRPVCSAATIEYGQPGIIWAVPLALPWTWQNSRCALVSASGRSHGETSTASTIRSPTRGSGNPATPRRSRAISIFPWLSPS